MIKPICIQCNCELHCAKNGILVHVGNNQYLSGDKWDCMKCGTTIVSGYSKETILLDLKVVEANPNLHVVADLHPASRG